MVFVPSLALSPRTLGIDGSVPRAVPNDAVVALLSTFLPGHIVQKLLLVAVFVLLGSGLGLVLKHSGATVVATVVAAWNPWIAQRLEVGHWGFVLGYAALPWVVWAAQNARSGTRYGFTSLVTVMMLVSLTGSTGVVLALIVMTGVLSGETPRKWKPFALGVAVSVLVSATWWWPFLRAASHAADPAGALAFAARADTPWGVVVSVLTGGGSWNQSSWYVERQSWLLTAIAMILVVVCIVGLWRLPERSSGLRGMLIASAAGAFLAVLAAIPGGRELMSFVITNVPGAGLIRDAQKFAGPWMIAVALGAGLITHKISSTSAVRARGIQGLVVTAGILVPIVLLPSLAWGSGGSWRVVDYPRSTLEIADQIDDAEPGSVAVFPWIQYRRYDWNDDRIVLDPWNRLLRKDVVINDGLPLRDGYIAGEDPQASAVSRLMATEEHLVPGFRALGIRHVLILTDQPGQDISSDKLMGARLVRQADGIQWWDLGNVQTRETSSSHSDMFGWYMAGFALILLVSVFVFETRKIKM